LIVTPDAFYNAVLPLAEWKHRKGMQTHVVKLSEIGGPDKDLIHDYVQEAYDTWEVKPEYVTLVGDPEQIPMPSMGLFVWSDNFYTNMDEDLFNEIIPGRLPGDDVTTIGTVVKKTLMYERYPLQADTLWYRKGTTIVREDGDRDDSIYWHDTNLAARLMVNAGFTAMDSLSYFRGNNGDDIVAAVNDGRSYVMYRGQAVCMWWTPLEVAPENTQNGSKLPVVVSATCDQVDPHYGNCGERWVKAGSLTELKGAVGFCGPTTAVMNQAYLRSAEACGFLQGLFLTDSLYTFGRAVEAGRRNVYAQYSSQSEYKGFTCIGDPELNLWTHVPRSLEVSHAPTVRIGADTLVVGVSYQGAPLAHALVCVCMDVDSTVYAYGYTDEAGEAAFDLRPSLLDTVWVTVTARNFRPYEGRALVVSSGALVAYESKTVADTSGGNGDGVANPGESVQLSVVLRNWGGMSAPDVQAVLRSTDPWAVIVDSLSSFGQILPDSSAPSNEPYVFTISTSCSTGHPLAFTLHIWDANSNSWDSDLEVPVFTARLSAEGVVVSDPPPGGDGDGLLEPGEAVALTLALRNVGSSAVAQIAGLLESPDPYAAIEDAGGQFGDVLPDSLVSNSSDRFGLSVSPSVSPGHVLTVSLDLEGDGGSYAFRDTLTLAIPVGVRGTADPGGPDEFGYWMYDDGDTASGQAPAYEWMELAPPGPGAIIPEITNEDAAVVTLDLPFAFRYYGRDYSQVSVCSNGFLAMGYTSYRFGDNSAVPDTHGPAAMVAPFWDDLNPATAGDIYQWYDPTGHRWMVEFDSVAHYGSSITETFEVALLDPAYHSTPTGDGAILVQYQAVGDAHSVTVGIEDSSETIGLQYLYQGEYDSSAAPLAAGRVILFTTEAPAGRSVPWVYVQAMSVQDSVGGNGNGRAEPGEEVGVVLRLRNGGRQDAAGVQGTLLSSDPDVVIQDGEADFGDIGAGGTGDNAGDEFRVAVSGSPQDTLVAFELRISANGGLYQTSAHLTLGLGALVGMAETGSAPGAPVAFALYQNKPNPFAAQTMIRYAVPRGGAVSVKIYNLNGQLVRTLVQRRHRPGVYEIAWDGKNEEGMRISSGLYFCRLEADAFQATRRLLRLR
jgi:hypothetical protein